MQLEDDFTDIIKKARHGMGLAVEDLAGASGLAPRTVSDLERGSRLPSKEEVEAIAETLRLRTGPLLDIASGSWSPQPVPATVSEVHTVLGDIGGYEVKGYVLFDRSAGEAILIDTGYNADAMLEFLSRQELLLKAVCLTHGHQDHAGGLDRLLNRWTVPVYLGEADLDLAPWLPSEQLLAGPDDGVTIRVGALTVECVVTPGHTPGGACYRVTTAEHEICFVGDTLFAGSIGRSNPFSLYPEHLRSMRERLLTLPAEAVLLPGHGPGTTVQEEQRHNPFAGER